jgi:IS30 family transposase
MKYHQLTSGERYMLHALRLQGCNNAEIARQLGHHRSTIGRELKRNRRIGRYRPDEAQEMTQGRRWKSRRRWYFADWQLGLAIALIRREWSPEQAANWLKQHRIVSISHQTLYRYIWYDRICGGTLYKHLRQADKRRRKRYGAADSRGVMSGKRHISQRPESANNCSRVGHIEIDTVIGSDDQHCIVTLVDRKTKFTMIGKLKARTTAELNRKVIQLIKRQPRIIRTITADNGTEFHQYHVIENATQATFYFCDPYHSWQRGLNENTNGLIRQYLPKGKSMADLSQRDCDRIAHKLNTRPRKTLGYKTPEQCYAK